MFASRTNWPLTPNRLSAALEARRREGRPVLDLTESNPTRCGFEMEGPAILRALANARALQYEPDPRGLLLGREAVAGYYAERGIEVPPERIFLTASTSEAYSYVFRLLANPGDRVLAPQPSYPLFDYLAALNDIERASYALRYAQGWHLDPASLEARLTPRSRAVVVVHPNNPTGSFIRRAELEFLAHCCRERKAALVADEVFADYAFGPDEQRVPSHAGVSEVLTFTLSGLSKISALPQMKLAWVVVGGPQEILAPALARLEIIADTYLSVSAPVAGALPRLLEVRQSVQPQILERVKGNLEGLDAALAGNSSLTRLITEGGWYAIVRLPSVRSDEEWAVELLREEGVLVHPGHFYDFAGEGHLVLSLLPPPAAFAEGVSRLVRKVESRL